MNELRELFSTICDMSVTACFVIMLVLMIRILLRKAPRAYSYYLCSVVGFRLLCPFSFSSIFSIFNLKGLQKYVVSGSSMSWSGTIDTRNPAVFVWSKPHLSASEPIYPGTTVTGGVQTDGLYDSISESWITINQVDLLIFLWILVCVLFLGYQIYSWAKLKKQMEMAVKTEGNVYESDRIKEPFVLGFFSPKIYLPFCLKEEERTYILFHERYHIRRHDHQVKILAVILLGIYWFNPFVWLAFYLMCKDMEMSCDEKVVSQMGSWIKEKYSYSLLGFAMEGSKRTFGTLAFGETSVKERVKNILKFKKTGKGTVIAGAVVCLAGIILGCANGGNRNAIRNISEDSGTEIFEYQLSDEIKSVLIYKEFYQGTELAEYEILSFSEVGNDGFQQKGQFYLTLNNMYDEKGKWIQALQMQFDKENHLADFLNMNYLEEEGYMGCAPTYYLKEQSGWKIMKPDDDIVIAAMNLDAGDGVEAISCETYQDKDIRDVYGFQNDGTILYHIVFSDKEVDELIAKYGYATNVRELFAAKNPYIGNHVADGKIMRILHVPDMGDCTTELQTSKEPYGMIIHYEEKPEKEEEFHEKMLKTAALFLAVTENAGFFEWTYPGDGGTVKTIRYYVEDIESMLGIRDLKGFAQSEEALQKLVDEVEGSDWEKDEVER